MNSRLWCITIGLLFAAASGFAQQGSTDSSESSAPAHETVWQQDVDAAIEFAAEHHRHTVIWFTADWSEPCEKIKTQVMQNDRVLAELRRRFVCVKVDLTDREDHAAYEQAERFYVRAVPTVVIVSPDQDPVDRASGVFDAEAFLDWLASF